jgi:iron complex transport system substrate-binding protein
VHAVTGAPAPRPRPAARPALAALAAAGLLAGLAWAGPAGAADLLQPTGKGAARGGAAWVGPRPSQPPRRVITLAPSLTDVMVALGHADRIVGVTRVDRAPEVAGKPRVGGFLDPNPEAILGLRPDLVLWVTDGGALAAVRRTAELAGGAFPVLAIPIVDVADVVATARLVGEALGDAAGGEALARRLQASVDGLRSRAAGLPPRRVLFVVGHDPLVVAGPGSFPDELLRLAGCRNAVGGERPWPVLPVELAVGANPDVVIDGALDEPPGTIQRLGAVPAVRQGRVVRLRSDDLLRPGPRMIAALDELFEALHPQAGRAAAPEARP